MAITTNTITNTHGDGKAPYGARSGIDFTIPSVEQFLSCLESKDGANHNQFQYADLVEIYTDKGISCTEHAKDEQFNHNGVTFGTKIKHSHDFTLGYKWRGKEVSVPVTVTGLQIDKYPEDGNYDYYAKQILANGTTEKTYSKGVPGASVENFDIKGLTNTYNFESRYLRTLAICTKDYDYFNHYYNNITENLGSCDLTSTDPSLTIAFTPRNLEFKVKPYAYDGTSYTSLQDAVVSFDITKNADTEDCNEERIGLTDVLTPSVDDSNKTMTIGDVEYTFAGFFLTNASGEADTSTPATTVTAGTTEDVNGNVWMTGTFTVCAVWKVAASVIVSYKGEFADEF